MKSIEIIPPNVSEITCLWNQYMSETAAICTLKHFLKNVEDKDTRSVLQYALSLSEQHVNWIEEISRKENLSIPVGFTQDDIEIIAPRLFTDSYYLIYLSHIAGLGTEGYVILLRYVAPSDFRGYLSKCISEAVDLYNKMTDIRLSKGLFLRAPSVEMTKKPLFPEDENIFKGMLIQKPRPMYAREITNNFGGILMDIILKAITTGLGQVASSQRVKEYMFRGRDIAKPF